METVDASLCGCGALGNSSQCVPEMLSEGNSGVGVGVRTEGFHLFPNASPYPIQIIFA